MSHDAITELSIHHHHEAPPPGLPGLAAVFSEAKAAGLVAAAITRPDSDEARRHLAKRRHDLKAALRTLGFTVSALQSGYTFQDDKAAAKVEAIARAVQVLEREGEILARLFSPD